MSRCCSSGGLSLAEHLTSPSVCAVSLTRAPWTPALAPSASPTMRTATCCAPCPATTASMLRQALCRMACPGRWDSPNDMRPLAPCMQCIDSWLKRKSTCPLCRFRIDIPPEFRNLPPRPEEPQQAQQQTPQQQQEPQQAVVVEMASLERHQRQHHHHRHHSRRTQPVEGDPQPPQADLPALMPVFYPGRSSQNSASAPPMPDPRNPAPAGGGTWMPLSAYSGVSLLGSQPRVAPGGDAAPPAAAPAAPVYPVVSYTSAAAAAPRQPPAAAWGEQGAVRAHRPPPRVPSLRQQAALQHGSPPRVPAAEQSADGFGTPSPSRLVEPGPDDESRPVTASSDADTLRSASKIHVVPPGSPDDAGHSVDVPQGTAVRSALPAPPSMRHLGQPR